MKRVYFAVAAIICLIWANSHADAQSAGSLDVTDQLEILGIPTLEQYPSPVDDFARNVWDMEAFGGMVYLASGNSYNNIPDGSAGPVNVWYYDPAAGEFRFDTTLEEDQIEHFEIIFEHLMIPGADSRGEWNWGYAYLLNNTRWLRFPPLPDAVHVNDLEFYEGRLFAAITSGSTLGDSIVSFESGNEWQRHVLPSELVGGAILERTEQLFLLGGNLYANLPSVIYQDAVANPSTVYSTPSIVRLLLNGTDITFEPVMDVDLFAGVASDPFSFDIRSLRRAVTLGDHLVYLGVNRDYGDHWHSFGIFSTDPAFEVRYHPFESTEISYDLITIRSQVFALLGQPHSDGSSRVRVMASCDLLTWHEVLRFQAPTFARSFARLGEDFYFGLGADAFVTAPDSGTLLRVQDVPVDQACPSS